MVRHTFSHSDFFDAAFALVVKRGPTAATVGAITARLKAPTGSFYHRFASRDALLGELWLRTLQAFQEGINAALDAGDGLKAALHTPTWVREHMDEGRLLLLHHRDDFVQGDWPRDLQEGVAEQTRRSRAALEKFARDTFGSDGADEVRRAGFILGSVPVAAVRDYLRRGEPPPPIVDELIRTTYYAIINGYHAGQRGFR